MSRQALNSALRTPLTEILGSKGHISILRELIDIDTSVSHSKLISRTGLSRQGVYDIVARLSEAGVIEYVGSGRNKQIELREKHPVSDAIRNLFTSEKRYFVQLKEKLKSEIDALQQTPDSAWIFGKAVEGTDDYGDPLQVGLLGKSGTISEISKEFRTRLMQAGIEKQFDVTIEIKGITISEIQKQKTNKIILLYGAAPQSYLANSIFDRNTQKTQEDSAQKALISSKTWIKFLKTHPEIIERTIHYLEEISSEAKPEETPELQEWKQILESMSFQRLKKFIEADSERSNRLRQTLPFWAVLNEKEKVEFEELKSPKY